jgi:hypothetical protein
MRRVLAACSLWIPCLLVPASPAAAEWHFTPSFGLTFAGSTTLSDPRHGTNKVHPAIGGSVSRFGEGIIAFEGIFSYTPRFFEFDGPSDVPLPEITRSYAMSLMGNVVLTVPRRWTEYFLRPFVSGGFGMMRAVAVDEPELFPVRSTQAGFNIGGGAIGLLSQRTGLRFDVRYHGGLRREPKPGEVFDADSLRLRYMTATVGVVIRR